MNPTFRAFVSSTYEDLKDHRDHVIRALRRAGFFVDPMEEWTAATGEPNRFSRERVNGCDLCVLIVAFGRGHIPEGEAASITQLEYGAAVEQNIDILVFMLEEQAPWPREFDELDTDPEMRLWRKQLTEHKGVGFFNHDPRSIEIEAALSRWLFDKYREAMETAEVLRRLVQDLPVVKRSRTYRVLESTDLLIQSLVAGLRG